MMLSIFRVLRNDFVLTILVIEVFKSFLDIFFFLIITIIKNSQITIKNFQYKPKFVIEL